MKKNRIVSLAGLLLPALLATQSAFADIAADLRQAEGLYKAAQYDQAEQAYPKVIREADLNKPAEWEAAFSAAKSLPLVYIATDRLPQAKEAVKQLLSTYAQYEFLPHAIHEIVEGAKPLLKLPQVRQLYQDMVTAQPGDSQAIWLKMGMAIASVHLAEDEAVDAVLQDIIAQHAQDNRAAEALNHIGWAYRKLQRYNEALTIYQYVVDNWPQKDRVVFAQQSIAICQVRLGNRQAADEALDVMLQKFGKDKNTSKLLAWSVYEYLQAGETEGACKVFDLVLQTYPEAPETIDALLALATAVIQGDDRDRIEPTVQTLLTRFAPTDAKASALHTVANMLAWKCADHVNRSLREQNLPGIFNRCLQAVADYCLATWPKSDWAVWAQRDLATVAIQRRDDATADAAIGRLTTEYANHKDTPGILQFLSNLYVQTGKYGEVGSISDVFARRYPDNELSPVAKAALAQAQIRQGKDADAEAIFQRIVTDYANHPRLAEAINFMAEGYRARAKAVELEQRKQPNPVPYAVRVATEGRPEVVKTYYRRAIEKWEIIINELPVSADITPVAYTFAGEAYDRIGDSRKALEYFTIVTEQYPTYQNADYALHMIGRMWQQLQEQGLATEAQAWPMMVQASEALLKRYPQSGYAPIARKTVDWITATEIRRKERTHEQQ